MPMIPALRRKIGCASHPWLHSGFEVSLGGTRPCPEQKKNMDTADDSHEQEEGLVLAIKELLVHQKELKMAVECISSMHETEAFQQNRVNSFQIYPIRS